MPPSTGRTLRFSIDRGGTFTDVFAEIPQEDGPDEHRVMKLLSEDPENYPDAPREGIRRVLEEVTGKPHPRDAPLDTSRIASIRMGTTVATNALLERKGERCAFAVTKGFKDLMYIGNQSRPEIFDLKIKIPGVLYEVVVEVDEEVILPLSDKADRRSGSTPKEDAKKYTPEGRMVATVTGEIVCVRRTVNEEALRSALKAVRAKDIKSLAVVLKHSYIFPEHEEQVGRIARELGFTQVSLSSAVMPMVKMVPRGFTAAADAYLTPHILRYIDTFQKGFDDGLPEVQLSFMQSDGGLTPVSLFSGHKAILSGPAGGYVGYALTTAWEGSPPGSQQIIGFDMGGTSTDVSRYAGTYEHVFESTTAGVTIQAPQLDINTVAAGGGSCLFFRRGLFQVGPESAGAHPGPVAYRKKGGLLTITDANLVLGRILPRFFPSIFGESEDQPLDEEGSRLAMEEIARLVNKEASAAGQPHKSVDEVAMGFLRVANETMCRPIRALTQMRGYDVAAHVLACFGGAGGQHACAIAVALGMRTIFVHRYSGILSAVGIGLADVVAERQAPSAVNLTAETIPALKSRLSDLEAEATGVLLEQGFTGAQIQVERYLNLRYDGTDVPVMTLCPEKDTDPAAAFEEQYQREFGFTLSGRDIVVDDVRVRATGQAQQLPEGDNIGQNPGALPEPAANPTAYFEIGGRQETPVYHLSGLKAGHVVEGPAILIDDISCIVIEPKATGHITTGGNVRIEVADSLSSDAAADKDRVIDVDPVQLAIFSHRFMGIAEEMGRTLQRTSVSVNIKERLDFSCALFAPDGGLVANAPHLPVHLGAMSDAVRAQMKLSEGVLMEGDVLVSNHPQLAGGSHLPDITVITPVFNAGKIVFYVASRGHHADVGGITPGSMPPTSRSLVEEGAAIVSFKLVRNGVFQEKGITDLLEAPGRLSDSIEGISGTRNLEDNLSDLRAQVAANNRGIHLVRDLIKEYGLPVVHAYMGFIQDNAEQAVRGMLQAFSRDAGLSEVATVTAEDIMDDGTPICLAITVDRHDGSAVFDFAGTGPEVFGNTNAPPAVTSSAVIYSLRSMVPADIPLNQGCLQPVEIKIPKGSILWPGDKAAVVGGNVLTSQRVTDVILKCFKAAAASQGCMNNLTFGDPHMGYYETIGGGAGAGPSWHGRSGVQTHMTNTRITDPEILERRYPVALKQFQLRANSGGSGQWRGGDGIIRELEFLRSTTASILSERRAVRPFGLEGGGDAQPGLNLIVRRDGHTVNLGGKNTALLQGGDKLLIYTPGGGGYGAPDTHNDSGNRGEKTSDAKKEGGKVETTTGHQPQRRASGRVASWQSQQESV